MVKQVIHIRNDLNELERVNTLISDLKSPWRLSDSLQFNLELSLEEIISNIIHYGFPDEKEHNIEIYFEQENKVFTVRITDDGIPFDPLQKTAEEELDKPLEERQIGGLGIHFVRELSNKMEYKRKQDKNILTIELNNQ
jgi:anti-sigma regulatory factor (Ser/Thr protein kinase)